MRLSTLALSWPVPRAQARSALERRVCAPAAARLWPGPGWTVPERGQVRLGHMADGVFTCAGGRIAWQDGENSYYCFRAATCLAPAGPFASRCGNTALRFSFSISLLTRLGLVIVAAPTGGFHHSAGKTSYRRWFAAERL